jgi:hypothetical protein
MTAVDQLAVLRSRNTSTGAVAVETDKKGGFTVPPAPKLEDAAGQCAWLTAVFDLDRQHPITGGRRDGLPGPDGHVVLTRAGVDAIRFEPATRINQPMRLIETLSWQTQPSDGPVRAFRSVHCQPIAYVVRMLCGCADRLSGTQEAEGIVGTFLLGAEAIEGCTTYGTSGQRYEAAIALRRDRFQRPRFLLDRNTGECVIAVMDLAEAARRQLGSSIPRGWLEARMDAIGWTRVTIDGRALPGRHGRKGPHARLSAFRGLLEASEE